MLISIMGVDGSGKTTLAKSLAKNIDSAIYKYAGYNPEQRKYYLMHRFIVKDKNNIFQKILKKVLVTINDFIEFNYISKNGINIYDRYIYDLPVQNMHTNRKYFYKFIQFFYKKPDLLIFLNGNAESIYARKKELTPNLIREMTNEYKTLFKNSNIDYYELDTIKLSKEELVDKVKEYYEQIG